jgi:hypothetical protein
MAQMKSTQLKQPKDSNLQKSSIRKNKVLKALEFLLSKKYTASLLYRKESLYSFRIEPCSRAVAKNNGSFVLKLFSKRYNNKIDLTD